MRRADLIDAGDQLRGAFVSRVLVAYDEHEGVGRRVEIGGAEPPDDCEKKREEENGAAHDKPRLTTQAAMRQARGMGLPFDAQGGVFT